MPRGSPCPLILHSGLSKFRYCSSPLPFMNTPMAGPPSILGIPRQSRWEDFRSIPLIHLDPLGAICLFLFNFGWAKPVPVDVRYFKNTRRDVIIMALAGPAANVCAALVAGLLIRLPGFSRGSLSPGLAVAHPHESGLGAFQPSPASAPGWLATFSKTSSRGRPPANSGNGDVTGPWSSSASSCSIILPNTGIIGRILVGPMFSLAHLFAGDNLFALLPLAAAIRLSFSEYQPQGRVNQSQVIPQLVVQKTFRKRNGACRACLTNTVRVGGLVRVWVA